MTDAETAIILAMNDISKVTKLMKDTLIRVLIRKMSKEEVEQALYKVKTEMDKGFQEALEDSTDIVAEFPDKIESIRLMKDAAFSIFKKQILNFIK